MSGEKKPLTRQDVAVIVVIGIAVITSLVALIRWEMGRACVRWSTRSSTDEPEAHHPAADERQRGENDGEQHMPLHRATSSPAA